MTKGLRTLGTHVAEQENVLLDLAERSEDTRRMLAEHAAKRSDPRRSPWLRYAPALASALVGVAAGLVVSSAALFPDEALLTFTVGEAERPGVLSAWEHAPHNDVLPIRFSDGTAVRLQPSARARVVRVGPSGADIVIESGRAVVDVVPNDDGSWRLRSGPFVVEVKGTRFEIGWSAQTDELSLRLFEGRVVVSGCNLGEGREVRAGQQLQVSCPQGKLAASATAENPAAERERAVAPPALTPPVEAGATPAIASKGAAGAPSSGARALASTDTSGKETWRDLARDGHYRRAYEIAAAAGFEGECERASADDALALGDAARLSGRSQQADHAYTTVRRRFPGSGASARAAFALGRSAFHSGNPGAAARWFETYLAEQPGGALAPAALDRLLEASLKIGDPRRTRAAAAAYLEHYPAGPHTRDAQRILRRVEPANKP